jgi:hypothetical protein
MEYNSIRDKMLRAVLKDDSLISFGEYDPDEYRSIAQALASENCIVNAVAQIIDMGADRSSEGEIYKVVSEYLKRSI